MYRPYTGTSATAQIGSSAFYIHSLTVPLCSVYLVLSKIFIYSVSKTSVIDTRIEYFLLYIEVKYEFSAVKKKTDSHQIQIAETLSREKCVAIKLDHKRSVEKEGLFSLA